MKCVSEKLYVKLNFILKTPEEIKVSVINPITEQKIYS